MLNFFPFGRKFKPETKEGYSLEPIPLFSSLSRDEQALIEQYSRLVGYKRGDLVYQEGTKPEAFFIIISGRFRLFTKARGREKEHTILYFYRGEHFGETSLLTGNVHSASIEAKTDGVLLKINADDFQKLLKQIPAFALQLSRSLGRHLTRAELGYSQHRREVRIGAFYYASSSEVMAHFLFDFLLALKQETHRKILLMDLSGVLLPKFLKRRAQKENPMGFDLKENDPANESDVNQSIIRQNQEFDFFHFVSNEALFHEEKKFSALLTYLTYQYDYLLLCLPDRNVPVVGKALNYSDRVYLWGEKRSDLFNFSSKKSIELSRDFGFGKNDIKIIMPYSEICSLEAQELPTEIQLFSMLPSLQYQRFRYEKTLNFLAKEWSERLVGLVLGSGAAYGLAHIGVLRVLEQEKLPVDIISGSSIGALIGALWAAGYDSYEIEKIAKGLNKKNAFFRLLGLQDISAVHRGFFKGDQISRFLTEYLKNMTFQDLKIPVKIVATDMLTAEEVIFESGGLVKAIRASISIPGFLRPFPYKGSYLIDGGILDPLPIKILTDIGIRKITAVNVLPGPKDFIERNELRRRIFHQSVQQQTHFRRILMKVMDRLQRRYSSNIFNVLMNTIQFMEFEIADRARSDADVFIHAVAPDAHWIEFFSADKFIEQGIKKTREQLAQLKQLLVE